jgi:uncharacterized membrane protein YgdD (TMEM256/DUF423 family)
MTPSFRRSREILVAAGIFGLSGVGLGALGAHGMAAKLAENGMAHAWDTGARYHIIQAVALLIAGIWVRIAPISAVGRITWAARLWMIGILCFSGSLYGIALGGPRWLGPITPLGGVALLLGWLMVIAGALAPESETR